MTTPVPNALSAEEARSAVSRWLREGGEPTPEVPYTFSFITSIPSEAGFACAGAALGAILGTGSAFETGRVLFGDRQTFCHDVPSDVVEGPEGGEDLNAMADYLDDLSFARGVV